MKLVFIHSGEKVKRDTAGTLYTDGSYNAEVWKMYLKVFSSITIVMREDKIIYSEAEAKQKFNIIPSENITYIPIPNLSESLKSYINLKLRQECKRVVADAIDGADAVIVRIPGIYYAIDYAKKKGKPCLAEVVGCPFDSLWNHSLKGKVLAPLSYIDMKKGIKKVHNLIYVTDEFLQRRYHSSGNSIGCSDVRLMELDEDRLENRIKNIANGTGEKIIIGTASGLSAKYKGQQYVIKTLGKLKKKGINCFEYQIAGNGDTSYLESVIKKYDVQDRVNFVGSIPHDKIFNWYEEIDIYVQPSKLEGLPRALIEAMSCGVPCVGSNVGGIPELLEQEVMFEKGSIKEIQDILLKMRDSEFRIKQAKKCFDKSKKYQTKSLEQIRINFMKNVFEVKDEK